MDNMQLVNQVSNSPILWGLTGITVMVSVVQTLLYMKQCKKATVMANLDKNLPKKAFKIGLVSAIGPAVGVFIIMVGLMANIGGPMAWLRLSIIGSAPTELTAANIGAEACGVPFRTEGYNLTCLAVSYFTMALNGAGWLLFTGLATPSLEKMRNKAAGGDLKWLGVLSAACSLGIFGFLNANNMLKGLDYTGAVIAGALSMVLMVKTVCKKIPKLQEYTLGIAMVIGIVVAICCSGQ